MVFTFGSTLSPGLVSYQVSKRSASFQPGSERSPSMVMGPVAFLMAKGGSAAAAANRGIAAMRTASSVRIAGKDGERRGKLGGAGGKFVTKGFVGCSTAEV